MDTQGNFIIMSAYFITQLLLLSAVVVSGYLIVTTWRNQNASQVVSIWFTRLVLTLSGWSLAYMLELAEPRPEMKLFWSNVKFIGVTLAPVTWILFCAFSTGQDKPFTLRRRWLLIVPPIVTILIDFTNPLHHLFWSSTEVIQSGDLLLLRAAFGPYFWVHAAYSYLLTLGGVILLVRYLINAPSLNRGRIFILLVGVAIPWVANIITVAGFLAVDLTPLGFIITASALAWGILSFHLLNIAPIARDALFDQMSDAILILDTQGHLIDLNDASRNSLQLRSVLGRTLNYALPKLAQAEQWINEARQNNFAMHTWTLDPDMPSESNFDVRISTLRDRNRVWVGYLMTLRDITIQKRAEKQIKTQNLELQQTNNDLALARAKAEENSRLKSEFLSVMSHELRTPLNAIMGFTELQMMGAAGELSTPQKDFLNRTLSSSHELLELINNVIDLTRLEAEQMPLVQEPFDTVSWWDSAIETARKSIHKKGLEFEVDIDPYLPGVMVGDAQRLQQVLSILLSNALKFTEQGIIKVWMQGRDHQWWEIGVQDSGIGVPKELHEAIFEAFRQADSSSRRRYGGMGLGLSLAQRLTRAMGGHIEMESTEDVGSTFRLVLPLVTEKEMNSQTEK